MSSFSRRTGLWVFSTMLLGALPAKAGVDIAPYVSIKSTKNIAPSPSSSGQENQNVKERREAGIRGTVMFYHLVGLQLGVGQSQLTTTQKTQAAADPYNQIDYKKDLNMSTTDPNDSIKITETQKVGKFSLVVDPSFSVFILQAKAGVTATQRTLDTQETGKAAQTKVFGPYYKPHSGFGAGVRFSPQMYFMAEYNFNHYAFPKLEPFEREVAVSFSVSM